MNSNKSLSLGFELLDIEIIDNKKESGTPNEKWNCDECSLFFLSKDKLAEHKNKHSVASEVLIKCRYCNKTLSIKEETKECYANRKCNTCEYKCSKCPLRFQRHSSFVNHEKSHSLLKKKKPVLVKKKPVRGPENQSVSNASKKKHTVDIVTKQQKIVKRRGNDDEHIRAAISPKKRKTLPGVLLNEKPEPLFTKETVQTNDKIKKQCIDSSKTSEEKTIREKQKNKANIPNDSVNNSSHDNTVNYKPFSCHICGENFASGDSLLAHIQSHGENVSKGFKCKHCGDEFDDIYKMQYHLAICPLAEDETVLVKNIPSKFHATPSNGPPRKLGRPKKMKPNNSDNDSDYEVTPSFRTRGSIKKRSKTDESSESASETPDVLSSKSSNYHTRLRINKPYRLEGNSFINEFVDTNSCYKKSYGGNTEEDEKESVNDPLNDSFENLDDDKAKVHSCPFPRCGIKFSREKALLCHMRNHNDDFEDSYKCHKCDIPFDDIQSLRSHLNECKDVKEEKEDDISEPEYTDDDKTDKSFQKKRGNFPCSICGRTYLSEEKLKRCLHDTVDQSETSTSCRLCGEICDSEKTLRKHFRSGHSGSLPFQCSICHAEFDTKQTESEHFSTHLDSDNFQCIICFANMPTYKDLYFHYKQDHVTKQQSICEICNKIFPNENLLKKHQCNSEERQKCIVCQKSFSSAASMTIHLKRHTNKKIYKCKICYRAFIDTSDLMKHMLFHATVMADEKPYKCCLCLVTYRLKSYLSTHITDKHIGKPLSELICPICGEMSGNKTIMASHIMRHSINVSKNKMTNVETEWIKQIESKPSEHSMPTKRGRPRKSCNDVGIKEGDHEIKSDISKLENQDEFQRDNDITRSFNDYLTNSDISTMAKQQLMPCKEQNGRQPCNGNTQEQFNDNNQIKRYNTRRANLKPSSGIDHSNSTKNHNKNDVISASNKPKLSVKSGLIQSGANVRKTAQIKYSSKLDIKSFQQNKIESRQRPMSFIKITSSYSKTNKYEGMTAQKSKKATISETSPQMGKTYLHNGIGKIKIEDEELDMSQTSSKNMYSNSIRKGMHENETLAHNKSIGEGSTNMSSYDKSIIWAPEIKKEETECFIQEKKYYEPSLGLTKFSCTTCLLSFSSQDELLVHNTQHIL